MLAVMLSMSMLLMVSISIMEVSRGVGLVSMDFICSRSFILSSTSLGSSHVTCDSINTSFSLLTVEVEDATEYYY